MVREGYKQTEVGEIPEDWCCIPLRQAAVVYGGYGFSSRSSVDNGIPWLKIANVNVGSVSWEAASYLPVEFLVKYKDFQLNTGDIVMALTRPILSNKLKVARISIDDAPSLLNQRVAKIKEECGYDRDYLYFVIQREQFISAMSLEMAGTDPPNIGTTALNGILIPAPSEVSEQIKIAKALSDVDELILSLEKLIAKKQDIKTAMMQQLLTGKKRLPGFGEGKGYKRTELGEIPEDWDVKSYGDIFDFFTTATNSRSDLSDKGSHYYIHYGDIHTEFDYVVDFDSSVIPRIQSERISSASLLKDGDLLMADASEDYEGIGKSVEVRNLGVEKAVSGLHTFLLRDKEETFLDGYRGYLHTITCVKKSFDRLATGLKVYGLSKNNLKQVLIPIPSKDEQREIIAILVSMREEIQCLVDRMKKTKAIKQGMMQELLTGRTRLVDVDAATQDEEERMHGT